MNGGFSHQHISWGVDAWAGTGLLNLECDMFKVIVKKSYGKGQLISKVIYGLLTSPKKQTDEFDLFPSLLLTANKSNSSVCF